MLKQLHLRDVCLKIPKRTNDADDWNNYRVARNKAVAMIRSTKKEFFYNALRDNKGNPRGIWKTIKTLNVPGKNRHDINSINISESVIDDKEQMAQQFDSHFSTAVDKLRSTLLLISPNLSELLNFIKSRKSSDIPQTTSAQVLATLKKNNPHKAVSIDKISAQLLCVAAPVVAPIIARLINFSFSSGSFPSRLKTAKVSPLYKSGDPREVLNYRPISVIPVLSKIIEKHMHDSLYSYLTENNFIYPHQSGFCKNHSMDTTLVQIIDKLLFNLDKNRVSSMVLVEYFKAFNMVDHALLGKLKSYDVAGESMEWFHSHLADRQQLVAVGGCVSDMAHMKHGVPQCSILAP